MRFRATWRTFCKRQHFDMRVTTMKRRYAVAPLAALGLICVTASAQVPPGMTMTPMQPPPEVKNAIPLYQGVAPGSEGATQKEKWATVRDDYVARNVTSPTLTPFLPAKDKATGAAVVVAPGGGFMVLSMKNEGFQVARYLADHGIAAF